MTTARPAPVRIDDYANPRFSPDVLAIHEAVAPMAAELRLEAEPMLEQARAETGLSHGLDDPGFRERLDVLLTGLRDEAGLSPFGVLSDHTVVLGLLRSRLLDPGPARPPSRDPRRSRSPRRSSSSACPAPGTTHLHNLISSDPALRSLPYWEALEPVLPPSAQPGARRARPALREHPGRARHDRRRGAAVRADARDDRRARARGDPAARDRLLVDAVRDDGA